MSLDVLMRLTRRTHDLVERLRRLSAMDLAVREGLVIDCALAALEHDATLLVNAMQLRAIQDHTKDLPHRAPTPRRRLPLSTEVRHAVRVDRIEGLGIPRQ